MRIKKRTRSTYQPLLSLGHILRNLAVDQYLIPDKHQLLSFSTTSHSHGVIALWQEGIPVEAECVPETCWVRAWRSRICAAFLNMSHEEEIVYKHIFGLLSKQSGSFCLLAYFRPIPNALFLWLSGKVKAKTVLAEEFWALSRIPPRPPMPGPMRCGPSADKTCREASLIPTQLLSHSTTCRTHLFLVRRTV